MPGRKNCELLAFFFFERKSNFLFCITTGFPPELTIINVNNPSKETLKRWRTPLSKEDTNCGKLIETIFIF